LSCRNFGYLKVNRRRKEKIFILSVLLINFLLTPFLNNFNIYNNLNEDNQKNEELPIKDIKTQDLVSDNTFTGVGAPWNVTHYANGTKTNLEVSFNNNSYDNSQYIELYGWMGYQLNSTITNLYDTRNWINGTFHCGPDDNDDSRDDNDSNYLTNWTFNTMDTGQTNYMSGNYFDDAYSGSDGADCLQLLIGDYNNYYYDVGDKCWWETIFEIDRGDVDQAWLSFAAFPKYSDLYNNHFVLQVIINNKTLWGNGLASMLEACGNSIEGQWYNPPPIYLDVNDDQLFPNGVKDMNITLEFKRVSGNTGFGYAEDYSVLIDNVSLIVKSKAKPSQLDLQLNNEDVIDNVNYGEGYCGMIGNWNGSEQSSVNANFSSNLNWPLTFEEDGIWISYKVELDTDLNLYMNKSTPESYYTADPDLNYQGSAFIVSNNSNTNWTTYVHMEIPTGYEETNMTIDYPSDYNLTGLVFSQNPDSLSQTTIKQLGNKKIVNIPVSSITDNTNGFWKLTAVSPNYCTEMGIYNNATDNWEPSNVFLSGDYINITARINNSQMISGYIQQTNAQLQIRFPNGTIWTAKNQLKQVNNLGMVYFDPFQIPNSPPNYKIGDYEALITWNNSFSNFNLNETGLIYKTFTVSHNSSLEPDQDYYSDIFVGDIVNVKVLFSDPENFKPIENAILYVQNFTGGIQYFNEINPGYYFLEFNTTGGSGGDQNLTIYATHPLYEDNKVNVTIGLIEYTTLTAEEYPSIKVPWNNNFTIHLNYTETSTGDGIEAATTTVYWNGDTIIDSVNGIYNVTCNNSVYQVNDAHNLKIELNKTGYESQTIIISIELVERETYIDEIFINDADCTVNKSYNIHSGELVNITVKYKDNEAGGTLIHNAMVTLNGTDIGEIFTDNNNFYNLTLNSTKLSVGISFLNIIAQKDNYTAVTELLTINVYERETDYGVYLNGAVQGKNPSIQLYDNQLLNITISYNDSIDLEHIPNAFVDINGSGISEILVESFNNYSVIIDTTDLNQGVNFLTIFVRKDGYKAHSILIIIEIIQIETDLRLFLEGEDKTYNPSITLYPAQTLNITISYYDSIAVAHIPNAIVDINGSGISEILVESFNNYSLLINTADLNQGANFLSIYARKKNYEPQTILLIIEIIQIETNITLFIDGNPKNDGDTIQVEFDDFINITVYYRDNLTNQHLSNAEVNLLGIGNLNEGPNQYTIILDAKNLDLGITTLTVFAQLTNYEPESTNFFIKVIEKATNLQLLLNGEDKTLTPVFNLTIGEILNVTVRYKDQAGAYIPNVTLQLIGEGIQTNFSRNDVLEQHCIQLNTLNLRIGVNLYSIMAQTTNYEIQTKNLIITVNRISTSLDLSSQINAEPGDDVLVRVTLNNLDFGGTITNVTVTYAWAFGQGELLDPEMDGTYEILLENVPEGNYPITITAFAGDNYDFESKEITLIVSSPVVSPGPNLSWLIYVLFGGIFSLVIGFTLYQTHYKYPPTVRKSRKIRKKIKKGKKTKPVKDISSREKLIKDHLERNFETIQLEKKTENGLKEK